VHQFQFRCLIVFVLFFFCLPLYAEVIELLPDQDSTLYEDVEGDVSNGAGRGLFFGITGSKGGIVELMRRALVRFDLSGIPSNAVINSVEVSFVIDQVPPNGAPDSATLHLVSKDWGEGASNPFGAEGQGAAAQSGVHGNIKPGSEVLGSPARPIRTVQRAAAAVQKLPATIKRVKELEKEVERLKERLDES